MARTFRLKRNRKSNKKGRRKPGKRSTALKKKRTKRLRREKMMRGGVDDVKSKNILLIIDPQNDFMDIPFTENRRVPKFTTTPFVQTGESKGLPVPNASTDMKKLVNFLTNNPYFFDEIHVSLDSHTATHIGHRGFWEENKEDEKDLIRPLQTFYVVEGDSNFSIYVADAFGKKFDPEVSIKTKQPELQQWAYFYILEMQKIRAQNEKKPLPCLWAEHCITGRLGWEVYDPLAKALNGKKVYYHEKGTNDLVEMYSIFSSEVKYQDVFNKLDDKTKEYVLKNHGQNNEDEKVLDNMVINTVNKTPNKTTDFNQELANRLYGINKNNKIYVCGEAKSHCVKTSIEDLLNNIAQNITLVKDGKLGKKDGLEIIAITDMMSAIPGFEPATEVAFAEMAEKGVQMVVSTDLIQSTDEPSAPQ
jgi:nicotinamidase-related amidase